MKKEKKIDFWIYGTLILLLICICNYFILQQRIAYVGLVLFYLIPFLVSLLSVILLIIALFYSIKNKPFFNFWRIAGFLLLILLFFNSQFYGKYPSVYDEKPSKVEFRVPTDSALRVAWGGEKIKYNYHAAFPDQCWAYDLVMTKDGKTYSGNGQNLSDYYCYGELLLAPASGKIVKAFDKDPDMPVGELNGGTEAYGNHVVIKLTENEYLYLCHLQPGSLKVSEGDIVQKGQVIGLIGNSGNTSEPHLHMHLQSELDFGEGIPLYFYNLYVNGEYVDKAIPQGGIDANYNLTGDLIQNNISVTESIPHSN